MLQRSIANSTTQSPAYALQAYSGHLVNDSATAAGDCLLTRDVKWHGTNETLHQTPALLRLYIRLY